MHSTIRAMVFWLVVVLSAFLLWFFSIVRSGGGSHQLPIISYSAFLSQVESGNVTEVTIRKDGVRRKEWREAVSVLPPKSELPMSFWEQAGPIVSSTSPRVAVTIRWRRFMFRILANSCNGSAKL